MTATIRALGIDPSSGGGSSSIGLAKVVHDPVTGAEELFWGMELSFDKKLELPERLIALHKFLSSMQTGIVQDAVVVENQHKWGASTKASIIPLAQAAGVCLVSTAHLGHRSLFPQPGKVSTLKGKGAKHDQMLIKLGLKRGDVESLTDHYRLGANGAVTVHDRPSTAGLLDVMDAITLARWGIKQEVARRRRERFE